MDRRPAVAGQFYPGSEESLRRSMAELIPSSARKGAAIGVVVPHAGYPYSGAVAGETFSRAEIPDRVILLGPNHHGFGHPGAVYAAGGWLTPLGRTAVDEPLAAEILRACPGLRADEDAHLQEHSLEVQLPFIQTLAPGAAIVPICLGPLSLDELLGMGAAIGDLLARLPEKVLMVASSDMTHYESGSEARLKDSLAIEKVLALDAAGLYRVVREEKITMCGVLPVVMMLAAAGRLGAAKATLVRYGNSGDVTGDQSSVVGYAGIVIERGGEE